MARGFQSRVKMSNSQQARYGHGLPSQHTRNYSGSGSQAQTGFNYESFQTPTVPSNTQSASTTPASSTRKQEFSHDDGDVTMEDADPYNRMKYPSRPNHAHRPSGQYLSHEDSAAARRYSPMNTFSPTSSYGGSPQQSTHNAYLPPNHSARQSPTRSNPYSTPSQQHFLPTGEHITTMVDVRGLILKDL